MTQKTYQLSLNFEQVLDVVLQLPEEEQEKIIQEIKKSSLKNGEQNLLSGFNEKSLTITQNEEQNPLSTFKKGASIYPIGITPPYPINKSKRAPFGVMKNSGKIIGDIVEPTSGLSTWDVLS
jgi:hypothetical protein